MKDSWEIVAAFEQHVREYPDGATTSPSVSASPSDFANSVDIAAARAQKAAVAAAREAEVEDLDFTQCAGFDIQK